MIKGGYYIKARCIQDSEIAHTAPHVREIWDWLLKESNHKDTKICKRGQCVRSYKDIQEGLLWYIGWRKMMYSKDQCEMAMKWLRKRVMITTTKTTRGLVITVVNYDKYQTSENYENHKETVRRTTTRPQKFHTINKNDKNDKNVKNDNKDTSEQSSQIQEIFDLFYKSINPEINFGNKTERKAVKSLIKMHGFEKVKVATEYAIKVQTVPFAPRISTPYQLKNKMGDLRSFIAQEQNKGKSKGKEIIGL